MSEQSVTQWIEGLKAGDEQAARKVWESYYQRLVQLARRKLRASPKRVSDEEDVVLSALNSFYRCANEGRFPRLNDRDDLWRLLFTITERKAIRQMQAQTRQKRGGGGVRGESALGGSSGQTQEAGLDQLIAAPEPTPEMAYQVADSIEQLLASLDDDALQHIALAKMQGYTNDEIADHQKCSTRSVKRRLKVIRTIWLERHGQSEA